MTTESNSSLAPPTQSWTWSDYCPGLMIFRVFRIACSMQVLLLAAVGAVAMTAGWRLSERIFLGEPGVDPCGPTATELAYVNKWPGIRQAPAFPWDASLVAADEAAPGDESNAAAGVGAWLRRAPADPIVSLPYRVVTPFWRAFDRRAQWSTWGYYVFAGAWTVVVWGLFGGIITRMAVMQLGRDERIDLWNGFEFGRGKWIAHVSGPLMPLFGVGLVSIPIALLGIVMRLNVGVIVGGILWGLVLAGGFLMTLLLAALLFGWPLMWAAISAEGTDGFDAISRSYAYTLQRPLHYLGYACLAAVLGVAGWGVVWAVSEMVLTLGFWGLTWGAGAERTAVIVAAADPGTLAAADQALVASSEISGTLRAGGRLIGLWCGLIRSLASGFGYSYFWCSAAAIYLLLRRSVDATEVDELFVDDESSAVFGLPKLKEDTAGSATTGAQATESASGLKPVEPLQPPPPGNPPTEPSGA